MIWPWPGRHRRRLKPDPRHFGQNIEKQAANYLRRQGLRLIRQNYYCRHGEIDLIMADRQPCLVFVEVRYRSNSGFGTPQASVTASKQNRLRRSAASFLQRFPRYQAWPCRFDVVAVKPAQQESLSIQWLRNAFM